MGCCGERSILDIHRLRASAEVLARYMSLKQSAYWALSSDLVRYTMPLNSLY